MLHTETPAREAGSTAVYPTIIIIEECRSSQAATLVWRSLDPLASSAIRGKNESNSFIITLESKKT